MGAGVGSTVGAGVGSTVGAGVASGVPSGSTVSSSSGVRVGTGSTSPSVTDERVLSTEMPTASVPSTMPPTDSSIARESKSARIFLFICTFLLSVYAAGQPEMFSAVPPSGMGLFAACTACAVTMTCAVQP